MSATSDPRFRKAQWQLIISSMIAYAFFYVTRKNLSMAQPGMLEEGVVTTYQLGLMMTVHGILYGVSRFVNGLWADRINGRVFMTIGLVLSALANVAFGCTTVSVLFAVFWIVNGWTQGMGSPACARVLSHWIHPREMATKYAVWNTSHDIGAVMALGVCTALVACGFGWRWCFWVPAALTALAGIFAFFCVKDSPTEAGVPEIDFGDVPVKGDAHQVTMAERRRLVFGNKVIWLIALANFFVYVVRFGFLDWGPTFLNQYKGISVAKGGLMTIAFELAAVVGTILTGWLTDRLFKGRGIRMCVFCMFFAALFSFGFWYLPSGAPQWAVTAMLMGAGFCIYGPQSLIGVIALNHATKEAAAMATGFTGIMGYASTAVSGIGVALIKEHFGWGAALCSIGVFAVIGMGLFLCAWNAAVDGYVKKEMKK